MTGLLRCFHRGEGGSLTVESMLTLPALLLALLLCVGLINGIQGAMALDFALAEACGDLAENSYKMQQITGLGLDIMKDSGLMDWLPHPAQGLYGNALATLCLRTYLKGRPEIMKAVEWQYVRLPEASEGDGQEELAPSWEDMSFDEDDVVLILAFIPARLNRLTSMLPDSWRVTMVKRERAWLTGRNLPPQRGQEQAAGKKEAGPLVYITRYGVKYHADGCRYLAKSQIPAYLNQLAEAYDGCSVCKPPPRG